MLWRCYNNHHADLGSFRVDDDYVFHLSLLSPAVGGSASSSELWSNFGSQCCRPWAAFGISANLGEKRVTRGKSRSCRGVSERFGGQGYIQNHSRPNSAFDNIPTLKTLGIARL